MKRKTAETGRSGALALLGLLVLLTGCQNGPTSTIEELGQDANTWGFGRRYPHEPYENEFTFGIGDEVVVTIPALPDLPPSQVVRLDGKITLPLINNVVAAGLTPDQLRRKLLLRFEEYLTEPESISVSIGQVQSKVYYIVYQEPSTGTSTIQSMPITGDLVLMDAFVGVPLTVLNDDCHVKVIKGDPRNPRVLTINLKDIYSKGLAAGNVPIQPDDIIYVPPTVFGRINTVITAITLPLTGVFRLSQSALALNQTARILSGDTSFGGVGIFAPGLGVGGVGGF